MAIHELLDIHEYAPELNLALSTSCLKYNPPTPCSIVFWTSYNVNCIQSTIFNSSNVVQHSKAQISSETEGNLLPVNSYKTKKQPGGGGARL